MTVASQPLRTPIVFYRALASFLCLAPLVSLAHCGAGEEIAPEEQPTAVNPDGGPEGAACTTNTDCQSNRCENGTCGAVTNDPAATGKCAKDEDCPGAACGDDGKCATAPSCARFHGGRTCGPDGKDDCCAVVQQGSKYKIDKYLVTAGRMRAFIERFQGDIQSYVESLGSRWDPEWADEDSLPYDIASANDLLGPEGYKKSCQNNDVNGHTYWTPPDGNYVSDLDQPTLDDKALNCVPWPLMQALCIWDGGHIATLAALKAGFTNNGTTKYPWGNEALASNDAPDPQDRLNIAFGFETSPLPATYRKRSDGSPAGVSFFISPPGRYPKGNNQAGLADSAGDLLEWVGDELRRFVWKADFEHHALDMAVYQLNKDSWWSEKDKTNNPWIWGEGMLNGNIGCKPDKPGATCDRIERNGYYAIGGRCIH